MRLCRPVDKGVPLTSLTSPIPREVHTQDARAAKVARAVFAIVSLNNLGPVREGRTTLARRRLALRARHGGSFYDAEQESCIHTSFRFYARRERLRRRRFFVGDG